MSELDIAQARFNMIEQQIRPWDVLDPTVLALLERVPREDFVPEVYRKFAFSDTRIPIGHGQVMMTPKLEGRILQALAVQPGESVFEIGTGSGYLTACLAGMGRHVTSMEIFPELAEAAQSQLAIHDIHNVAVRVGDVTRDWPSAGQYDAIAVTGSLPALPDPLLDALRSGGRLFAIVGKSPVMEAVLITKVGEEEHATESLFEIDFPVLVNATPPPPFVF